MITPDGEHLTPEAEDFVKSYDEAKAEEWLVDGTEAVDDATRDEKSFREIVRKKLLPMAGRVLGLAGGAYTAYEVCSALLEPGCWVFGRDDTEIDLEDSYGTLYGWYWVPWVG